VAHKTTGRTGRYGKYGQKRGILIKIQANCGVSHGFFALEFFWKFGRAGCGGGSSGEIFFVSRNNMARANDSGNILWRRHQKELSLPRLRPGWQSPRQGLVTIFLQGRTSRPWAESPALVKQNGLPPMRQGLQRKSRRACEKQDRGIGAESPVFAAWRQKGAPSPLLLFLIPILCSLRCLDWGVGNGIY
jgi:hypothetical protein